MGIARSTYYADGAAGDDTAVVEAIASICDEFEAYGWRRVHYLIQLKSQFTSIELRYAIHLQSVYAMRIYELLKQYRKIGERVLSLASAEVVEFVGERRAEATVGESGAGAPRC